MSARIAVFGTCHDVQGAEKRRGRRLDDAQYRAMLDRLLHGRDFVFEEATGLGPSTASKMAEARLGPNRYLDVDPAVEHRSAFGIARVTGYPNAIDPSDAETDFVCTELVEPQGVRENLWVGTIAERDFENALLICGFVHTLSISFKLYAAGYTVEAHHYVPWHPYCRSEYRELAAKRG